MDPATLHAPCYTYAEVARYVGINPARVRRWLKGYTYSYQDDRYVLPPVVDDRPSEEFASFADLMEVRFINQLIEERRFSLQHIRKAAEEARRVWGPYPFMMRRVFTDTKRIIVEAKEGNADAFVELLSGGQTTIPSLVDQIFEELVFEAGGRHPVAWLPMGPERRIEVDPRRAFGSPVVTGHRLKTSTVYDMYRAEGMDTGRVCWWFEITEQELADAVAWEEQLKRPRKAA